MGRPREFEPSEVLQTAIGLFWEKGYFDSSVDELVRKSGVAKYGIYGTFGTKRELFDKALAQYASDCRQGIQSPIRRPDASLPEIRELFERAVELMTRNGAPRGCLIVNSGLELALRDAEVSTFVRSFFEETEAVMARCLTRAVELGEIDDDLDIDSLARYLVTEFRTALMLAGTGSSRREIQAHLEIALRVLP